MGTSYPVSVCIPWRPQDDRLKAFDYVMDYWRGYGLAHGFGYHAYSIIPSDGNPHLPFSLSEARNQCVNLANDESVVIVTDADTVHGDPEVIHTAVKLVGDNPEKKLVIYPFESYKYISEMGVILPYDKLEELSPLYTKFNSVGGMFITSKKTYFDLGGMDERFNRCWGFEDNAFVAVADTLGEVKRLKGTVYSFHHEVEGIGRNWEKENPNYWRNQLYQAAYGNRFMMQELIK